MIDGCLADIGLLKAAALNRSLALSLSLSLWLIDHRPHSETKHAHLLANALTAVI